MIHYASYTAYLSSFTVMSWFLHFHLCFLFLKNSFWSLFFDPRTQQVKFVDPMGGMMMGSDGWDDDEEEEDPMAAMMAGKCFVPGIV